MKLTSYCNRIIEYSFYALFFFVPLVFSGNTSELFEFNKMWVTFGLTIIIATTWLAKMLLQKKSIVKRTPLDIPLMLFLISQIISTIFSLDTHVSLWGYYSRFNGGLLSTIAYIILYYAFVSNLEVRHILKSLKASLIAGLLVALWGLPSHFGADPTCFVFRGNFDTSCWTDAFKPTVRAFSTLGQPDWFAAYLAVLIPVAMGYFLKHQASGIKNHGKNKTILLTSCFLLLISLFYVDLIFANARAGFIAFWVVSIFFWIVLFWKKILPQNVLVKSLIMLNACFLLLTFVFGSPVTQINNLTLPSLSTAHQPPTQSATSQTGQSQTATDDQTGITDSGKIRLLVWHGAIDAWRANLQNTLIGTGVETFAFAYYQYRPKAHNLTSECDYLYNKAHNEYLNYLTTTGIFGLGTYLAFLGLFIFLSLNVIAHFPLQLPAHDKSLETKHWKLEILPVALLCAWLSILITNFFGFSVVIMNLFLFLIPVWLLMLTGKISAEQTTDQQTVSPTALQWTGIVILIIVACYLLLGLFRYWYADSAYALGMNLDHVDQFQQDYPQLLQAVSTEPDEPVYKDELSLNLAALSVLLYQQKDTKNGQQFANNAIILSNQVVSAHPNNVVFWKNRVRVLYTVAQGDTPHQKQYYQAALQAIQQASDLAPTDAKTWYNYGVLTGQTGNVQKAIQILQHTIYLKPDYRDAYFALGTFYHQLAVDKNGAVVNETMQQKAIQTYQYILDHISPNDPDVKKSLQEWNTNVSQ